MENENLLVLFNHPGGMNSLIPIIKKFKKLSKLSIATLYSNKENAKNIIGHKIFFDEDITNIKIIKLIRNLKISVLITGTSEVDHSLDTRIEQRFIFYAKRLGIHTISLLDFDNKFNERFSTNQRKRLNALPDVICFPGKNKKIRFKTKKYRETKFVVTGNPSQDKLYKKIRFYKNRRHKQSNQSSVKIETLVFISQPISERGHSIGYSEFSVLDDILNNIACNAETLKILIKLHPSENLNKYREYLDSEKYKIDVLEEGNCIFDLDESNTLFIGMFSRLLLDLEILGLKVLAYQPSNIVQISMDSISLLTTKEQLKLTYENNYYLSKKKTFFKYFSFFATERFLKETCKLIEKKYEKRAPCNSWR